MMGLSFIWVSSYTKTLPRSLGAYEVFMFSVQVLSLCLCVCVCVRERDSVYYYLCQGGYIFVAICLFVLIVCLSAGLCINYPADFYETWWRDVAGESPLHVGADPDTILFSV